MERLQDAKANPTEVIKTPDTVMVRGLNRRRALRRQSRVEAVVDVHLPRSRRAITGFTTMPPAQVKP